METEKMNLDQLIDRKGTGSVKWDAMPNGAPADALPLWVADMDFRCAPAIIEALHKRVDHGIFGYSLYDTPECKAAIQHWFQKRFQWEVDPEDVFFSPGVVPAVAFLLEILTQAGDGVVIQRPVYYPFMAKIEATGRKIVDNPLHYENGAYTMDFADLDKKLADPNNKGLILCSPHNPVGRVWTQEELRQVVDIAKKYDKWIISDEIHFDLTRKGVQHHPLLKVAPDYKDRIVVCTAPSKTFNLAGIQLSNIVIPNKEYQKAWLKRISDTYSVGAPNAFAVTAMIAAYEESEDWLNQVNGYIDGNMAFAKEFFQKNLPEACMADPQGTYLIWVDLSAYCKDGKKLEDLMLNKAKVALDEGYIFGEAGTGFERINAACPRSILEDCLNRMKDALLNQD